MPGDYLAETKDERFSTYQSDENLSSPPKQVKIIIPPPVQKVIVPVSGTPKTVSPVDVEIAFEGKYDAPLLNNKSTQKDEPFSFIAPVAKEGKTVSMSPGAYSGQVKSDKSLLDRFFDWLNRLIGY